MSASVFTAEAAKKANIELITDPHKGRQAVHDVVVALQANRRRGTASTKTKADVALSGAKPWRQKGTGRARAGYKSSPVWVGGGVAFGPHPRDYSKKVPKKVRTLALRKALSERTLSGDVILVEVFAVAEPKTKAFLALLEETAKGARKTLLVSDSFDEKTCLAARNVAHAQLARAADVNTEQLLAFDKIILTSAALSTLSQRLSQ
jgi:large subunit ribosomal protein L4